MVTDAAFLDAHFTTGVGQYDVAWDKIEAEWYMAANDVEKRESPYGGFEIQKIKNNGFLSYPNVKNIENATSITFYASSITVNGTIEIHANTPGGKLIGKVKVAKTKSWKDYQTIVCPLKTISNVKNIVLKFKGDGEDLIHLDWFKFN
jgi:hypothetical protein